VEEEGTSIQENDNSSLEGFESEEELEAYLKEREIKKANQNGRTKT